MTISRLSRRMKQLTVRLSSLATHQAGTHIIIDGSGLSTHGVDEFRQLKNRSTRIKGYRRIHLAINEHQEITACELTTSRGNEKKQVPKLLRSIRDHCECILADKNYIQKQRVSISI